MIRRTTHFSGRVQGVGFRYTAQGIARGFSVTGYVRNLPDGRVEVVAEGEAEEISRFLAEIGRQMEGNIKQQTDDDSPATGEFSDFGVRG
jgi:acylphosphatase